MSNFDELLEEVDRRIIGVVGSFIEWYGGIPLPMIVLIAIPALAIYLLSLVSSTAAYGVGAVVTWAFLYFLMRMVYVWQQAKRGGF